MSREKKTRPSVGAPGRAVETGSASRADTTSKPQFTPNGPGGQRKVADLLSGGKGCPFWRITPYPPPSMKGPPACALCVTGQTKLEKQRKQ